MNDEPRIRVFRYFRDQRSLMARLGVVAFVSGIFQAASLVLVVPLANAIAANKHEFHGKVAHISITTGTGVLAALAAGSIVVAGVLDIWIAYERSRMTSRWEFRRREQIIAEFLASDYETQAAERLGTLGTLAGYVNRGSSALGAIVNGLEAVLTIAIFVAGAVFIDYRAALVLIATVVLMSIVLRPVMQRTKRYSKASAAMVIEYGRDVTEATRMARDVRVFDATEPVSARLTGISRQLSHLRQRASFANGVTSPIYQYLGMLLIVLALGAAQGLKSVDITAFGAIALLVLRSLSFGQQLQNAYQAKVDCVPYIEKLESMRADYLQHTTKDGTITLESVHRLDIEDVRFSYDGVVDALVGVSASFGVGEMVGIVGPSGGGKSTLSQLILRLREPTEGRIAVNRMAVSEYTLASYYRHVSLVPQDPRLLHASIADNIAFLDPSIDRDAVVAAAKAAGLHDVIVSLDQGYDTMVGAAFRDLSGGQIQRIGIARALARGAQILVLDEPTSALDVHSEQVIQETLEALRGKVLVMIIAHRLSTLSICDRIMVLKSGRVETIGSLSEVSERSDFFRRALDAGTLEIAVEGRPPGVPADDA